MKKCTNNKMIKSLLIKNNTNLVFTLFESHLNLERVSLARVRRAPAQARTAQHPRVVTPPRAQYVARADDTDTSLSINLFESF